jgi:LysR family transcriptional regulator, transcriptional activator of nhaA
MSFLNYHHLMYFWTVAREGGVARAAEKLHLSSPTISAQIHELEDVLGDKLFERRGRTLVLTEMGQIVYKYAEDIFTLGRELVEAVKLGPDARPRKLTVGITDGMPKIVSLMLLEPALALEPAISLVETEGKVDELLANLATFKLDLVLSETPLGAGGGGAQIRAYNQLLGESGTTFFGSKALHAKYARDFPKSLDGAPVYLPTRDSSIRRGLDQYFDQHDLHPRVLGEFEDSAMLNTFGAAGRAMFPVPSLVEEALATMYNVKAVGSLDTVRARFYAISPERRLKHPGVAAICSAARKELFR